MWTYFIQAESGGPIKIGFTSGPPEHRLSNLQTGSPVKLRLVGLIPGDKEKDLHRKFAKHHSHGEWFKPSNDLLRFIESEASDILRQHVASQEKLKLDSVLVPVLSVGKPKISASFFEYVFPNNDQLRDRLVEGFDWNENGFHPSDDDDKESEQHGEVLDCFISDLVEDMVWVCEEAGSFVESVGVNPDAGTVGFMCGPVSSKKRMLFLEQLGRLAFSIDCQTAAWFFFAVFWDGNKQIGIDLVKLGIFVFSPIPPKEIDYIFDPSLLFVTETGGWNDGAFDRQGSAAGAAQDTAANHAE